MIFHTLFTMFHFFYSDLSVLLLFNKYFDNRKCQYETVVYETVIIVIHIKRQMIRGQTAVGQHAIKNCHLNLR